LLLGASYFLRDFGAANRDALSAECSFCSDSPSPPALLSVQSTEPQHERGIGIINAEFALADTLRNFQGVSVKKGFASLVKRTIVEKIESAVLEHAHEATQDLVQSVITKGYDPGTDTVSELLRRQVSEEGLNLMNSSIEIRATFQLVALERDYSLSNMENDVADAFKSSNFTEGLSRMSANIMSQEFKESSADDASSTSATTTSNVSPSSTPEGRAMRLGMDGGYFTLMFISLLILL
jgi:hypothetical protein